MQVTTRAEAVIQTPAGPKFPNDLSAHRFHAGCAMARAYGISLNRPMLEDSDPLGVYAPVVPRSAR